jgi:eukaryotic-like serine/threonine-protein kinase
MPRVDAGGGELLPAGFVLGRYEIRKALGRGGMGTVYEALHRDLKKRVAVKVLTPSLAGSEEARLRFLREGEAASRIRHPHVVDVTDVGTAGDLTYLVMELLSGEDLASRLARDGALPVPVAVDLLLPVCAGVAAAHDEGVTHRDLKPENIFLSRPSHGGVHPVVLDFGVSKLANPSAGALALTGTAATFGTPFYIPPEQLRGARQADHRSDQYALGVVLYECVTGKRPFQGESVYALLKAIGDGNCPRPRDVRPDLPPAADAAIVRAMQLDPALRFPSTRAFAAALLPLASQGGQLLWGPAFASAAGAQPPDTIQAPDRRAAGAGLLPPGGTTQPMPGAQAPVGHGSGGSLSGTKVLLPGADTTFGTTAGEAMRAARAAGSRRGPLLIVAGAAAVAGALFFLFRGSPAIDVEAPEQRTTDRPAAAARPPAATLPALPQHRPGEGSSPARPAAAVPAADPSAHVPATPDDAAPALPSTPPAAVESVGARPATPGKRPPRRTADRSGEPSGDGGGRKAAATKPAPGKRPPRKTTAGDNPGTNASPIVE